MALRSSGYYYNQRSVRFPRKRGRGPSALLRIVLFLLAACFMYTGLNYFLDSGNHEESGTHPSQTEEYDTDSGPADSTSKPAQLPQVHSASQSSHQNNAAVVAQASRAYREQNSTLSSPLAPVTGSVAGMQSAVTPADASLPPQPHKTKQEAQTPASAGSARPASASSQIRLHKDVSWNIPYVGYKLEEIATAIQQKYPSLRPGKLTVQPNGVQATLPNIKTLPPKSICLTINGCDPLESDSRLLQLLKDEKIPTAFFLSSLWIAKHKKDFAFIEKEPSFSIQAHGKKHLPLSLKGEKVNGVTGTDSILSVLRETEGNLRDIQRLTNKRPTWFRAAFNMYDPNIIGPLSAELSLPLAGYSLDANDTTADGIAGKLLKAAHGDIIMLRLDDGSSLFEALATAIPRLKAQGFIFVPLPVPGSSQ